ncbi:MAG: prepilin-type N-terminal cleavage/methylation domain-containing protein [Terriglobales bacterium]
MGYLSKSRARGFTFIELMVAMTLGLLIVAGAVKLFSQGVDATWVVDQRAEMQQDLRAVENMMIKDISLAGAGIAGGQGIALPSGGVAPIYGCDQTGLGTGCPPNGGVKYPCASIVGVCIPTLYGLIPGFALGIKPPGSVTTSDLITVAYSDTIFALNCYTVTFVAPGNVATFTAPANPPPSSCILPPGLAFPQNIDNTAVGLQPGDLIYFQNTKLGPAIAEVTGVAGASPTWVVTFANGDPLKMNQSGATGDLTQISGFPAGPSSVGTVANRIFVITYYLKVNPDPTGVTAGTPVLMRQVNGHTAVPAAENIINTQFTYDTYAADGTLLNQLPDGGESLGVSLNLIRKINIAHLTIRSQLDGARSTLFATNGYQGYDVQTSVSARNLSYQNRYSFGP